MAVAKLKSDGPIGAATAFWRSLVEYETCDCGELDGLPLIRRQWPGVADGMRYWVGEVLTVLHTGEWRPMRRAVVRFPASILPMLSRDGNSIVLEWDVPPRFEFPRLSGQIDRITIQDGSKYPRMVIETSNEDGLRVPDIELSFPPYRA